MTIIFVEWERKGKENIVISINLESVIKVREIGNQDIRYLNQNFLRARLATRSYLHLFY
jgi:hypothetical protein